MTKTRVEIMPHDITELTKWLDSVFLERMETFTIMRVDVAVTERVHVLDDMELLDTVTHWRHLVMDNCLYTCCATGACCRHNHDQRGPGQMPCTCGTTQRQAQVLGYVARRYRAYPGFKEEWLEY